MGDNGNESYFLETPSGSDSSGSSGLNLASLAGDVRDVHVGDRLIGDDEDNNVLPDDGDQPLPPDDGPNPEPGPEPPPDDGNPSPNPIDKNHFWQHPEQNFNLLAAARNRGVAWPPAKIF